MPHIPRPQVQFQQPFAGTADTCRTPTCSQSPQHNFGCADARSHAGDAKAQRHPNCVAAMHIGPIIAGLPRGANSFLGKNHDDAITLILLT